MSAKKASGKDAPPKFEDSLKRLEEIVEALEKSGVTLDEVMKMYEEGVAISKQCLEYLNQAEVKMKRLSKDAKGTFELFDEQLEA